MPIFSAADCMVPDTVSLASPIFCEMVCAAMRNAHQMHDAEARKRYARQCDARVRASPMPCAVAWRVESVRQRHEK